MPNSFGLSLTSAPSAEPITLATAKLHLRIDDDDTTQDALILAWIRAARRFVENATGRQLVSAGWQMVIDRFPGVWQTTWGGWGQGGPGNGLMGGGVGVSAMQGAGQYGWQWWLDVETIRLPQPPLQSVTSITYYDESGTLQTLDSATYNVDAIHQPGLLTPVFGETWPLTQPRPGAVQINFLSGYGPVTTIAAAIAAGSQTVTPGTMAGITVGTVLLIDAGAQQERVVVSAVTSTTFTATFAQAHGTTPVAVAPDYPPECAAAVQLLLAHWYEHRVAVDQVGSEIPLGVQSLIYSAWDGRIAGDGLSY